MNAPEGFKPSLHAMSPSKERMLRSSIQWLTNGMSKHDVLTIVMGADGRPYHKLTRATVNEPIADVQRRSIPTQTTTP